MKISNRLKHVLSDDDSKDLNQTTWISATDGLLTASQPILAVWALTKALNGEASVQMALISVACFALLLILRRLILWPTTRKLYNFSFSFGLTQRRKLLHHLVSLPLGAFNNLNRGKVSQILSEDMLWLENHISFTRPSILRDIVAMSALFIAALIFDWRITVICLGVMLLATLAILIMRINLQRGLRLRSAGMGFAAQQIIEFAQGMPVLRAFGGKSGARDQFEKAVHMMREGFRKGVFRNAPLGAAYLAAIQASIGVAMLMGVLLLDGAVIAGGANNIANLAPMIGAIILLTACIPPARSLNAYNGMQILARISDENISQLETLPSLASGKIDSLSDSHDVSFEKVSFCYDAEEKEQTIDDVSFTAKAGTLNAIVGRSGSGKSTLMHLLMRFWDIEQGAIKIDDKDIRLIKTPLLLDQIATVFQETMLFNDTIANNLRIGRPDASDDELVDAAKAAQIHDFIETLPTGYDSLIGVGGANLSGGQKQRIAIARAILKDAPIIILDEATSALDPENEAAIQQAFLNLAKDKTVFVIAHRLSTIVDADQILVLDDGKLIASGVHETLRKDCEIYNQLWAYYESGQGWQIA